MAGTQKKGF